MTDLQEHWEGVSVFGEYTLEQWLGGDSRVGFFQTAPAPDGRRGVVKVVAEAVVDSAALLDLWHRIRQLRHPNLIELLDYGTGTHGDESVVYAVFELPDDTLASALSRSPLDPQESRQVLDALVAALRYLHAQGLVLDALDPSHIVAVGDRIKLSTGILRDAVASSAYREDVRLLGNLWQQHLMSASPKSSEIVGHLVDPDPRARWTLAEISAVLNPPAVVEPPPAPPPPISAAPVIVRDRPPNPAPTRKRSPKWIFAGAAAAALLVVATFNRPHAANVDAPSPTPSVSLPPARPLPAPLPKAAVPNPTPAAGKAMWRVIAFTYRSRDAAAKKAQQLNQRDPGLGAAVFTPKDKGGYYLVSLGGRITHEEALRLQRSARNKGLPRDLYVQNYSE